MAPASEILQSLLTEQCVDITSVIQIKNEGDDALEPYQFWNDLSTVFRRGLKKKSLIHTTRWQLTAFKVDLDGLQLFDEVATLCYDLLDQRKAFNDFCDSVKIIQVGLTVEISVCLQKFSTSTAVNHTRLHMHQFQTAMKLELSQNDIMLSWKMSL